MSSIGRQEAMDAKKESSTNQAPSTPPAVGTESIYAGALYNGFKVPFEAMNEKEKEGIEWATGSVHPEPADLKYCTTPAGLEA